ncbi:hypothetical protein 1 [Hubei sobemo-like virus 22]|uniref:hypothetical protein 1 n=1 Tax=Hubei sobemo-like virus 22 TaxID=1923208 RepID=UPI00090A3413|nr:hypothetical protein 1 [Hubei sobemo-like virus 22]APG75971.1 hypothetical protein 1 [Hubei sobemo-like virus 22]
MKYGKSFSLAVAGAVGGRYVFIPVVKLAWNWVVFILWTYNPVFLCGSALEEAVLSLNPEWPAPPKPDPPIISVEMAKIGFSQLRRLVNWIEEFSIYDILAYFMCGIIVLILISKTYQLVKDSTRQAVLRARGVSFESMRAGSVLVKGEIPKYQVAVLRAGLLRDGHVGYGIRVGNYLVAPHHVVTDAGEEVILSSKLAKVMMPPASAIRSRVVTDLVYVWLPESFWVKLGVPSAKFAQTTENPLATCAGPEGVSSGLLRKSQVLGLVNYFGSTLPGFSGAAYEAAGHCMGIHIGAVAGNNMGISAVVVVKELAHLVRQESSQDVAASYSQQLGAPKKQMWGAIQIGEIADRNWGDDAWHLEQSLDYDQILSFDDESKPRPAVPQAVLDFQPTIKLTQHSDSAAEVSYSLYPSKSEAGVEARLTRLEERCVRLEQAVLLLQEGKGKFPCDSCPVVCRTQEKLDAHVGSAHVSRPREYMDCSVCGVKVRSDRLEKHALKCIRSNPVKPESAVPCDARVSVKTDRTVPFLGKRSRPVKLRPSKNTSTTRATNRQSQLLQELQSSVREFQRVCAMFSSAPQQATNGQNLAPARS